ncbi:hypothetical protein AVEN_75867-1 [Araneus ventricosus]|uniref:Uncharacterized protein n=1 Tax=Araneus ventricosus TaxID=182803 RepID=A0A4Y2HRH8_ARAVE|nr:hypothetical protein AVEN_75867-1 [Araneus ventricosus]
MYCFSFFHPTRICEKSQACHLFGTVHDGPRQGPAKCSNCQGPHSATSKACPMCSKEQQMLKLKSRNHLTTEEVRRNFSHTSNANYATAVKSNMINNDFESTVNQKIESIVQPLLDKMEQQTLALMKMFEKTVETLLQNFFKMMHQAETNTKSPL